MHASHSSYVAEAGDGQAQQFGANRECMEAPVSATPLQRVLALMQCADATSALADLGIAPLPVSHLDALARAALEASVLCRDRATLMLHLVDAARVQGVHLTAADLMCVNQHVAQLLREQERWRELADNASYYRDHPAVAARVSARAAEAPA